MRGLAGTGTQEGDEAAKIELTYSNTSDINRARQMLGRLLVCIIRVGVATLERRPSIRKTNELGSFDLVVATA